VNFILDSSRYGDRVSTHGRNLGVDCANVFEIALDGFLTPVSIDTSFGRSGLDGYPISKQVWNLVLSVLKSERSRGLGKDDRYRVSIIIDK